MNDTVSVPIEWLEQLTRITFPPEIDQRMQRLMDLNNEGKLSSEEFGELGAIVDTIEKLSLIRAEAQRLLGRNHE